MKILLATISALLIILAGCTAGADPGDRATSESDALADEAHYSAEHADDHIILQPGAIEWQDGPASMEEGAEAAILEGDPSQPGFFNLRLRMPDGYHIAPHTHPQPERVTVISGTFLLGEGEQADASATHALEPGSYFSMPPGMRHFAYTEGETVIQLTSTGPWTIEYVNPEDDPRLR